MKTDAVFKRAFNQMLDLLESLGDGRQLPPEESLSVRLGVSRTTVRKVIDAMVRRRIIRGAGRSRFAFTSGKRIRRFPVSETVPMSAQVEKQVMEWMLRGNVRPGAAINELELARQFKVATTGIREFLNRFQSFGLIERRPNAGWIFKGFTPKFALELFEIREMFEVRSATTFVGLPHDSPLWVELEALKQEHRILLENIGERYHDFSDLDSRFHRLVNASAPNRFIDGFYDLITFIFHYHYQWNKHDERQRNEVAIREHLAYIDALQSRKIAKVQLACRDHLTSAKATLIRSTSLRST